MFEFVFRTELVRRIIDTDFLFVHTFSADIFFLCNLNKNGIFCDFSAYTIFRNKNGGVL